LQRNRVDQIICSMDTARRWATPTEAARYSRTSTATIRRRIKDGSLAAYRTPGGRALRVDLADVDQMITAEGESPAALTRQAAQDQAVDAAVRQLVAAWPPLTEWQRERLRELLDCSTAEPS